MKGDFEMIPEIKGLAEYVLEVCKEFNGKLNYAYNDIKIRRQNKNERSVFVESEGFKNEKDINEYYNYKLIQVSERIMKMGIEERYKTFSDSDICRSVFRDIIKDDSGFREGR